MRLNVLLLVVLTAFTSKTFAQASLPQIIHAGPDDTLCNNIPVTLTATIDSGTQGNLLVIQDDTYSQIVNIGFPFTFFGNTYTQCLLSTNAYITFDLTGPPGGTGPGGYSQWPINGPIPDPAQPTNAIMGPWHDVDPSVPNSGHMAFGTFGTAPNRFFVFNFCNIPMFSCNSLLFTGQIILYETSNIIETHIGNKPLCSTWNTGQAIHGLQDATGTNAVVVPGRNAGLQWTTSNEGTQFVPSGTTYTINSIPYNPVPFAASAPIWTTLAGQNVGSGFSINVSPTQTTTYVVSTTDCAISTDTVTIYVGTFTSTDVTVNPSCNTIADGSINTTPNGNTGPYNYTWFDANNNVIHTSTGLSGGDGISNLVAGNYSVTITNSLGCSVTHTYTLTAGNYNSAFVYSPQNICNGSPVSFTDASTGNITGYSWTFGDGGNSSQQNPNHIYTQNGNHTVQMIITVVGGCTDTASVVVNVIPNIVADFNYVPSSICEGSNVIFTDASTNNPIQWTWDFGDGSTGTQQDVYHAFSSGNYTVTLTVVDSLCGTSSTSQNLAINFVPNPYIGPDTGLCVTEKITLNAGYTGSTYLWSTGATTQSITVTASDPQWYWVTVNNQGCTGTDSLFIDIRCDVNMPNAFSPNGDGSNDMFKPITKKVDTYQLHVYNRWGNEVYYYSGPGSGGGWDGTYKGVDAEVGVYDYYIKASFINGISYEQQGNVTLLR